MATIVNARGVMMTSPPPRRNKKRKRTTAGTGASIDRDVPVADQVLDAQAKRL